jgi:hypothetical protein
MAYYVRDFPYGTALSQVQNQDVTNALSDAGVNFNPSLCENQTVFSTLYLALAAHYLVMNIQAGQQGVASQATWIQQAKSVGSVSGSYAIPPRILNSPLFAQFSQTRYGMKYLTMLWPRMQGPMFIAHGHTKP